MSSKKSLRICVFGSSSKNTVQRYVQEGERLGEEIAIRGYLCVNGAGHHGCMGGVNKGVENKNGRVRGIIHEKFCVDFGEHPHIKDLIMSKGEDLSERKQALLDNGDCVIVLPGGVGTFDEFWDAVCGKSLGMKGLAKKPLVIVNIDGFYDGFIQQLKRAYRDGILYGKPESYYHVENDAISALNWCEKHILEGDLVKDTDLLISNIKVNNLDDQESGEGSRVKTRPLTERIAKAEEEIVDRLMDYKSIGITFIFGLFVGVILQSRFSNLVPAL